MIIVIIEDMGVKGIVKVLKGSGEYMTENKRFKIVDEQFISYYGGTGHLISNGECKIWLWHSEEESQKVCDKLNSILDENEQLKDALNQRTDQCDKYYKENEQLKQSIKEVVELLSEEVDVFSDKATEHDINAYIELKELDNKDAYYMATATKEAIKLLRGIVDD